MPLLLGRAHLAYQVGTVAFRVGDKDNIDIFSLLTPHPQVFYIAPQALWKLDSREENFKLIPV